MKLSNTATFIAFFLLSTAESFTVKPSSSTATLLAAHDGNKGKPDSVVDDIQTKAKAGEQRAKMDLDKIASKIEDAVDDIQTKQSAVQSRAEMDGKKVGKDIQEAVEDLKTKAKAGQQRAEMDIKKVVEGDDFNN